MGGAAGGDHLFDLGHLGHVGGDLGDHGNDHGSAQRLLARRIQGGILDARVLTVFGLGEQLAQPLAPFTGELDETPGAQLLVVRRAQRGAIDRFHLLGAGGRPHQLAHRAAFVQQGQCVHTISHARSSK